MNNAPQIKSMEKANANEYLFFRILKKYYLVCLLVLMIAVFGLLSKNFLTLANFTNILVQNAFLVVATIGITFIMIAGGADLSISNQMSLVAVITCMCMVQYNLPVWLCVVIGIALGAFLGFLNGYLANKLKVHSIVVSLGTMTIYQGVSYMVSGSKSYFNLPSGFKAIGQNYIFDIIPIAVIIMFCMVGIAAFLLNKTYFGRYIFAIGGNSEAARLAGVNTRLISIAGFAVASTFIAISGIMFAARAGSANAGMAGDTVFTCITACVLGGISFGGGGGKVSNVVIAVFILGVLSNGMQLIGMGIYPQYVAKGIILLTAIGYNNYQKRTTFKLA